MLTEGLRLEQLWSYDLPAGHPDGKFGWLWCSFTVLRVSDGTVHKKGVKGQDLMATWPAGFVLARWDPTGQLADQEERESWVALPAAKWRGNATHAWRLNLDQPPAL